MIRELWAVYKVLRWHKKTFPKVTYKEQTAKRRDEIHEWIDAFDKYTKDKRKSRKNLAEMEWADPIIAGIGCLRFKKTRSDIEDKMYINRMRSWYNNQHKGKKDDKITR